MASKTQRMKWYFDGSHAVYEQNRNLINLYYYLYIVIQHKKQHTYTNVMMSSPKQ